MQLRAWLEVATAINQRELVGLLRSLTSLRGHSPNAVAMVLDVMRFCVRLKLATQCPKEVGCLKDVFDQALCAIYAEMRTQGVTISAFWAVYGPIAGLVVDTKLVEAILQVTNKKS